ncbi:MAG TPA: PspA/IM30 family protein [Pseudonocardia sp.]|jgi:phage shock protein A
MANGFAKGFKYLGALFSSKVDEYADPKIQIQQAIGEMQEQHQALNRQAAAVIGNQRQLEMKLNRQLGTVEKLQNSVRQAITQADAARNSGDEGKARRFEQTAQSLAGQLVIAEKSIEDLKVLHDQSLGAAAQAKQAVERNERNLQQKISERTQLLSQLEQAKMQEKSAAALQQMTAISGPGNTPSLDEVRDKIEARYANALGSAELAQNSVQGQMLELEDATYDMEGAARLEQIRASLGGGSTGAGGNQLGTSAPKQVTGGSE